MPAPARRVAAATRAALNTAASMGTWSRRRRVAVSGKPIPSLGGAGRARRTATLLAVVAAVTLIASACSGGDHDGAATTTGPAASSTSPASGPASA